MPLEAIMSGNKKHGYMRSNNAARNGVGMQKGFFCVVCQKLHGPSVARTGFKGNLMCDRQYLKLKQQQFRANVPFANIFESMIKSVTSSVDSGGCDEIRV
jgi:hypothetical protein